MLRLNILNILIFVAVALLSGCGERYSRQGERLSTAVRTHHEELSGCSSNGGCEDEFQVFGEHGNRVNLNIYGARNKADISETLKFVSENGMRITEGVPISLRFYSETKKELVDARESGSPTQTLRVDK